MLTTFSTEVKDNQPKLFDALDALPWREVPVQHTIHDRAHGRDETRTIQVCQRPPACSRTPPGRS